ncbi:hypothetical protein [Gimesia aquarii]|uniref:Uncharacterized protein n=1 Tax=Gimesia aquarii TaxID=2527964 RepID=A0A517VUW2_9PLAN|nr:hypothetical protein [Gimesia aquarii]QDT96794.1 hypothetical protein V144x_22520 [Gimesia aquarii]
MKAKISTVIKTSENQMWDELQKTSSLMYVASPILKFKPEQGHPVPEKWDLGTEYKLQVSFFGILPLGSHIINLVELNKEENRIVSHEHGSLTSTWNHIIKFNAMNDETIEYTDEVEIHAGIGTLFVWLFAHIFYRHRQNKWKKLLHN